MADTRPWIIRGHEDTVIQRRPLLDECSTRRRKLPAGQCRQERAIQTSMELSDLTAQGGDQQTRSKLLTLEQQRKFEKLRERRLQLQKAQDVANSRKKKRTKGKKGNDLHPEAADGASEKQQDHLSVEEDRATTQTAVNSGSEQRHLFTMNAATGTAGKGSFSQSNEAGGGEGGLNIEPFTTEKSPSATVIPAKSPVVPAQKKKRKKLHWGMEIKERWERKANM